MLQSYLAYNQGFTGGVFVAAGDLNGDGKADVITGPGSGGPHIQAFSGADASVIADFLAIDPKTPLSQIPFERQLCRPHRVAAIDANGDEVPGRHRLRPRTGLRADRPGPQRHGRRSAQHL